MKLRLHLSAITLVLIPSILCRLSLASADTEGGQRRFEVRDSVEMSYFGTIGDSQPDELDDDGIVSPDGRRVVKVTHRGVLPEGVTEGTIWMFDAPAVERGINNAKAQVPAPVALTRISATTNGIDFVAERGNTISKLKWSADSGSLLFLGRHGRGNRQLFRVDVETHALDALTSPTQNVVDYAVSGRAIAYLAGTDLKEEQAWWSVGPGIPDITVGTGQSLLELLYPHWSETFHGEVPLEVWQIQNGVAAPVIDRRTHAVVRISTRYVDEALGISPDGTHLVTLGSPRPPDDSPEGATTKGKRNPQYRLIDLELGTDEPLVNSAIVELGGDGRYRIAWSPSGTAIALSGTTVPAAAGSSSATASAPCTVAIISLPAHQTRCVVIPPDQARGALYALQWKPSEREILVRYKHRGSYTYVDTLISRRGSE